VNLLTCVLLAVVNPPPFLTLDGGYSPEGFPSECDDVSMPEVLLQKYDNVASPTYGVNVVFRRHGV